MQYRATTFLYYLGDRKPLEKMEKHLNAWADAGWRLVATDIVVTGADQDGREHHFVWERG